MSDDFDITLIQNIDQNYLNMNNQQVNTSIENILEMPMLTDISGSSTITNLEVNRNETQTVTDNQASIDLSNLLRSWNLEILTSYFIGEYMFIHFRPVVM